MPYNPKTKYHFETFFTLLPSIPQVFSGHAPVLYYQISNLFFYFYLLDNLLPSYFSENGDIFLYEQSDIVIFDDLEKTFYL